MKNPPSRLEPGATVGIFGGGQLGRMLAVACAKLGLRAAVYAPEADSAAFDVTAQKVCAGYDDLGAIEAFARQCDVLTFEFENIPRETLESAGRITPVLPPPRSVEVAQNRIREKTFLSGLGLPVVPHRVIETKGDLEEVAAFLASECPDGAILKRAAYGYDGKGQFRVHDEATLREAFAAAQGAAVLEARVTFACEISVISVRGRDGAFAAYDLPLNRHADGILKRSEVPGAPNGEVVREALSIARKIGEALDYVGVLTVEFFVMGEGAELPLLINEIAPRVHNSGHWTLDACTVSQFENHIRAVAGWPIGSTERHSDAVMTNLLGSDVLNWRDLLEGDPSLSLHLYGKKGIQQGRKLGHVTRITPRNRG